MPSAIAFADVSCALGDSLDESVDNLLAGRQNLTQYTFDGLEDAVRIPYFAIGNFNNGASAQRIYPALHTLVEKALAQLTLSGIQRRRTGIFIGSSSFDVNVSEKRYREQINAGHEALPMPIVGYGKIVQQLQQAFGLGPHGYTYSTACTSSANALLKAHQMLQMDIINHALIIGVEFFNHTTALGFHGLGLISPSNRMTPFDARRDGLILGEACGLVALTKSTDAQIRFCGGAIATDNHSLTAANSDGSTIAAVIHRALQTCQLNARDLVGMKAHGTASLMNDEAEAAGILRVGTPPPLFALKPYIGHTLGACGVLETALMYGCLQRGHLPANAGGDEEEDLGVSLLKQPQAAPAGYYGLNFFAFGGNNTCLILQKAAV